MNNISTVIWKEPDKLDTFDKEIVCLTNNNKVLSFKTNDYFQGEVDRNKIEWQWRVKKYNIKYWCYLTELIPNIDNNTKIVDGVVGYYLNDGLMIKAFIDDEELVGGDEVQLIIRKEK